MAEATMPHEARDLRKEKYMYYVCSVTTADDSSELYLVHSELGWELTTRLLLYAIPDGWSVRILGEGTLTMYLNSSHSNVQSIGMFIDPRTFTEDTSNRRWSLLDKKDAEHLLKIWRDDARYAAAAPKQHKHNYFKNAVDNFSDRVEILWPKPKT